MQTSHPSINPLYARDPDRWDSADGEYSRSTGLLVVALVAFAIGLLVGTPGPAAGASRADWPKAAAPHPRSIGN